MANGNVVQVNNFQTGMLKLSPTVRIVSIGEVFELKRVGQGLDGYMEPMSKKRAQYHFAVRRAKAECDRKKAEHLLVAA